MDKQTIIKKITHRIREKIKSNEFAKSDKDVLALIEDVVLNDEELTIFPIKEKAEIINNVFCKTRKDLNILQPYADDDAVSEIMVNGMNHIFIERDGRVERISCEFDSITELEDVIRRIGAKVHREINELTPILDARLDDGSRVNAVYKNIALNGPILTIRKFPKTRIKMNDLLEFGTISEEAAGFLKKLVEGAYNIFISGGTSSGKTTFLNVLSNYIPKEERIIVIEDSAELQIEEIENIVRLECKNANVQGKGAINMKNLIKTSLRMRPNRIIVGEVRGEEVVDMIQAMNTGHDGSLSTGHGNSPTGMLYRLEAMFLQSADFPAEAIRRQITEGIDIMVHLGRVSQKKRVVLDISEIQGMKKGEIVLSQLFKYVRDKGLVRTENKLRNTDKLKLQGVTI